MIKAKTFPFSPRTPWVAAAMQSTLGILAINWVFQGVRGMDAGERVFRLVFFAIVAILAVPPLSLIFGNMFGFALAVLIAHSVNFTINGQFWVCARYSPLYQRDPRMIDASTNFYVSRIRKTAWIHEAVIIGSRSRGHYSSRSDIDLRLVAPAGFVGWFRSNCLLLALRTIAFVRAIPLDAYVYDRPQSLLRFHQDEPLTIVKDQHNRLREFFVGRELKHASCKW